MPCLVTISHIGKERIGGGMLKKLKKFKIKKIPSSYFRKHQILFIAVIGILILLGISKVLYQYFVPDKEIIVPLQVQTIRVKEAPMSELIETIGTLTAKTELKIKAGASGRVQQLLADAGSWVKEGTLLANIIAAPEVRAPFDGYLTDWQIKTGEYVTAGTELIELVNTDLLFLTYRVPEHYAGRLEVGQIVQVSVKAFPDQVFEGVVHFVSPIVDRKTYTILVRAEVKNPHQNLWPGMSAHVSHLLTTHPNALVVPESCLILTMEGYDVFVVVEGKIERRTVEIGEKKNGRVHIKSGLNLNEPIVLVRTSLIEEGSQAKAVDWLGDW